MKKDAVKVGAGVLIAVALWALFVGGQRLYTDHQNITAMVKWAVAADNEIVNLKKIVFPKPVEVPK